MATGISVPCGDGRNPSPSGEEKSVVVWSRATVSPWSAHEIGPQSSPGVDPEISEARVDWRGGGSCARFDPPDSAGARVGSPVRKVARDHVHVFVSYRPNQDISTIVQWLKGISSRVLLQEFPHLRKAFWGKHFWARGYLAVSSGTLTDEMIQEYIEAQDGRSTTTVNFQLTTHEATALEAVVVHLTISHSRAVLPGWPESPCLDGAENHRLMNAFRR